MSNHAESSNTLSSSSSHYNAGSVVSTNPNSLTFNNHHSFSLNPHFSAAAGLNRLFNAGLDHTQAFLGFYHKSPASIKTAQTTTDDDNISENEGSVSNGSNQDQTSCQINGGKRRRVSNDHVDNDELSHDELANQKSSSESN